MRDHAAKAKALLREIERGAPAKDVTGTLDARRCVYFVQGVNGGPIKIGYTKRRLSRRLEEVRPAYPYELRVLLTLPGPPELEREMHAKFRASRAEGEWFQPSRDLVAFIVESGGVKPMEALDA